MKVLKLIFRISYPYVLYMMSSTVIVAFAFIFLGSLADFNKYAVLLTGLSALLVLPLLFLFFRKDCRSRNEKKPQLFTAPSHFGLIALLGFGSFFAGNYVIVVSQISKFFTGYSEAAATLFQPSLITQLWCIAIVVPIVEEMVFRILGFRRLRDCINFTVSTLITSFLFGLFHQNVVQFVYAFFLSCIMCYAYEVTGDFKSPIVIHIIANLLSVLITNITFFAYTPLLINIVFALIGIGITAFCIQRLKALNQMQS